MSVPFRHSVGSWYPVMSRDLYLVLADGIEIKVLCVTFNLSFKNLICLPHSLLPHSPSIISLESGIFFYFLFFAREDNDFTKLNAVPIREEGGMV